MMLYLAPEPPESNRVQMKKAALNVLAFLAGVSGLAVEQRPAVAPGLLAQEDAAAHVASSLLEVSDTAVQGRQERVENMLSAEQAALLSQEQALESIAAQQASLAQQQQALKEREAKVEEEISQKLAGLDASFAQVSASSQSGSSLEAGLETLKKWHPKTYLEMALPPLIYLGLVVVAGWIYGRHFTYPFPEIQNPELKERPFSMDDFTFGLFDAFSCDPDKRIFCCSCFCLPIRWADTASSPKINFMAFLPGLMLFATLISLINLTYGATFLAALGLGVLNRQRIRNIYGLPHKTCASCTSDTATWLFCSPCAVMQEAMQVEFVESSLDATVPQMVQMNHPIMDKFSTAPPTTGNLAGTLPAGQRKANQSCC